MGIERKAEVGIKYESTSRMDREDVERLWRGDNVDE
jgi:hypothetical protein